MLEALRDLAAQAAGLRKSVRALKTAQVRRSHDRDAARALVDTYFRGVRAVVASSISADVLAALDQHMQALLDASNKLGAVATYIAALDAIIQALQSAEKLLLLGTVSKEPDGLEPIDVRLLKTLSGVLPSAACAFQQAITDLRGPDRVSWRGPATDLRECLRELLDHLAPDKDVESDPGFKLEPDTRGPTMRQKVRHILLKRGLSKSNAKPAENAAQSVEDAVGTFVRSVYQRSSVSTHTPTDKNEVLRVHTFVRACLSELLEVH
jgi:hypothetical protein